MSPTVSVIIPTYQRADLLPRALDSVLAQSFSDFEVVVVDDNIQGTECARATAAVLKKYDHEPRFRHMSTAGREGGGVARNLGIQAAKGKYIAFLDDDDVFLVDKLKAQVAFMDDNALDFSFQDVEWLDTKGEVVERRKLDHVRDFTSRELLRAHLIKPISPSAIYMIRKELLLTVGGFGDVKTGQDWHLALKCFKTGCSVGYQPGVYVSQYIHPGDRLSVGQNKIDGETDRHKVVREYYHLLSKQEQRYVEFRHNAVLAVSSYRGKHLMRATGFLLKAFLLGPDLFVREGINLIRGRNA